MVEYISHRGNLNGPDPNCENHPFYIALAVRKCFMVEVDIWYENDKWYLGHDEPQYEITSPYFLTGIYEWAWKNLDRYRWAWKNIDRYSYEDLKELHHHTIIFHCKTVNTLLMFTQTYPLMHYFYHENDKATLTSFGYVWCHPKITKNDCYELQKPNMLSVLVQKDDEEQILSSEFVKRRFGMICTDYAETLKNDDKSCTI